MVWKIFFALSFAAALAAGGASAQALPPNVQLIVPFSPGGPVDFTARVLADGMRAGLGIPVVVENRPGANGAVAAVSVKNAPADGKALLFASSGMVTIGPHMDKKLPANSLKEFVELARASQPPLVFGSPGRGNHSHLNLEQLKDAAKIDLLHVPYKGAAAVLTQLLGGQITGAFIGVSTALPHVRAGKLKALGVTGKKRSAIAPEIPTFEEQGYSGLDIQAWTGILAPRNTRAETVKALASAVLHAVEQKDTNARLLSAGMTPWVVMGGEFERSIKSESEHFKKLIVEKNLAGE